MGGFNQEEFKRFILENGVVGFYKRPVRLKSGRFSHWYVNWRGVAEDVFLLDRLTDYIIAFTEDLGLEPECFYGVPEGATKTGIITQYKWARKSRGYGPGSHVLPMGRGRAKQHGAPKDRYFLGQPRGKTIVIEDVATTGDSLIAAIDSLGEAGTSVTGAFALTDRMEVRDDGKSVREMMELREIPYYALSDALELLPEAYRMLRPGEDIARAIEEEFERYGVRGLRMV